MKVKELMTRPARACFKDTALSTAASMMWDMNCGSIPVIDRKEKVIGMITDRDICMATTLNHVHPDRLKVADVAQRDVVTCLPTDEDETALKAMRKHHIHRLPVVDDKGKLEGLLSITDFVRASTEKPNKGGFTKETIVDTLREVRTNSLTTPRKTPI